MSYINVRNPLTFNMPNTVKTKKNVKLFKNATISNRWSGNANNEHTFTSNNVMGLHTMKTNNWAKNIGNNDNRVRLPTNLSLVRHKGSRYLIPKKSTATNKMKRFVTRKRK